ncbi:MAG: translation initiation factor IF-2, partial [Chloroflexi bacterium]
MAGPAGGRPPGRAAAGTGRRGGRRLGEPDRGLRALARRPTRRAALPARRRRARRHGPGPVAARAGLAGRRPGRAGAPGRAARTGVEQPAGRRRSL